MGRRRAGSGGLGSRGVLAALAAAAVALAGCGDLVDVNVALDQTSLRQDFGASAGNIPPLACDASDAAVCGAFPIPPGLATVRVGCDPGAGRCFAETDVRLEQVIALAQDGTLGSALERQAIGHVRAIDIAFTVPTNTLTFALGTVDLFVSAGGDVTAASGAPAVEADQGEQHSGDVLVSHLDPLAAGQTVTATRHVQIAAGSPAHAAIDARVRQGQAFALALVLSPHVLAGSPLPGGVIEIDLRPTLRLGVSWSEVLP